MNDISDTGGITLEDIVFRYGDTVYENKCRDLPNLQNALTAIVQVWRIFEIFFMFREFRKFELLYFSSDLGEI